jgi:hypothetical protein
MNAPIGSEISHIYIVRNTTGMLPMDLDLERAIKPLDPQVQVDVRGLAIDLKAVFGRLNKKC